MSIVDLSLKQLTLLTRQKEKADSGTRVCDPHDDDSGSTGNFELDVYREHLKNRKIIISGVIDSAMLEKVTLQILNFNEQDGEREARDRTYNRMHDPITLLISSPGGYLSHGLGIVSQIVQSDTPVLGYAVGDVASMATVILASCHARFSSIYSRVMIHSLSGGCFGKYFDMLDDLEESKKQQRILDDILTSRTLITQKMLDTLHERKQDWYLSSAEAMTFGLIDEVIPVGLKMTPPKKRKPTAQKAGTKK